MKFIYGRWRLHVVGALCAALLGSCATKPQHAHGGPEVGATGADQGEGIALGRAASQTRVPVVVEGTGSLIGTPEKPEALKAAPGDGFQVNFVDTDISSVVGTVIGDGLNLPYVIDPPVKGTMTLQATRPLSSDEVLAALEAALRVQGIALVDIDGVYHVMESKDASHRVTGLRIPGQGARGFGTYVVPLQYVSATEMQKTLQPFAPDGGVLRVDEARNLLLLAGTSQEIATLLSVVKTFDVDWLAGMSFALYPLEYVDAKTISTELSEVFADPKSPISGLVRLVPLARLNSLMVVTPQPKYLKEVENWIKRLDLGMTTPGRRIYVYDVQNGKADELAGSLNRILSLSSDASGSASSSSGYAGTQGISGAGGLSGSGLGAGTLGSSGGQSPIGSNSGSGGALGSSPFSASSTSGPVLGARSNVSGGGVGSGGGGQLSGGEAGGLRIVPSSENNSILVFATPTEFTPIEAALKRLDVLPIEVLIEASIAEVTLTDDLRYGLQFAYKSGSGPVTLSEAASGAIAQSFPGLSFLYTGRANIPAVLNALESLTNVRVLSSPKLVVLNNHEADIQVGDQVPVVTAQAVSTNDSNAPIVNSVQLLDTGVILHVTPRANKSGRVMIDVAQEVSDVVPTTTSSINSPTVKQRKLSSTVAVRDGETIALGGLIRDQRSNGGDGIPLLRRIPLLGGLFGSDDRNHQRTEMIVLITPHVIRNEDESDAVMEDLQTEFKSLRDLMPHRPGAP